MALRFRERRPRSVGIELSPLIDVVFQLLIFFAVTTSFLQVAGLELDLPESDAEPAQRAEGAESRWLTIEMGADGTLAFQGEPVRPEDLEGRLKRALAARRDALVVLRADREARHGQVVSVMDGVRRAGARGLSVATRLPARPRAGRPEDSGK
jgi:biopolymer transport protein ExbD